MRTSGLRNVSWVSVTIANGRATAVAHGVGHRSPRSVRITMTSASALAAEGVPTVVRRNEPL